MSGQNRALYVTLRILFSYVLVHVPVIQKRVLSQWVMVCSDCSKWRGYGGRRRYRSGCKGPPRKSLIGVQLRGDSIEHGPSGWQWRQSNMAGFKHHKEENTGLRDELAGEEGIQAWIVVPVADTENAGGHRSSQVRGCESIQYVWSWWCIWTIERSS